MYIKNALIGLLLFIPLLSFGQVKVDDVGDGWKAKVDSAIQLIKVTDTKKYNVLTQNCASVKFWIGKFSTTEDSSILISSFEATHGSVNDIAACLVHESLHLHIKNRKVYMTAKDEEEFCYAYELDFLRKVPGCEQWLLDHALEHSKD